MAVTRRLLLCFRRVERISAQRSTLRGQRRLAGIRMTRSRFYFQQLTAKMDILNNDISSRTSAMVNIST